MGDAAHTQQIGPDSRDQLRWQRVVAQVECAPGRACQGVEREAGLENHRLHSLGLAGRILDRRRVSEQQRAAERNLVRAAELIGGNGRRGNALQGASCRGGNDVAIQGNCRSIDGDGAGVRALHISRLELSVRIVTR